MLFSEESDLLLSVQTFYVHISSPLKKHPSIDKGGTTCTYVPRLFVMKKNLILWDIRTRVTWEIRQCGTRNPRAEIIGYLVTLNEIDQECCACV